MPNEFEELKAYALKITQVLIDIQINPCFGLSDMTYHVEEQESPEYWEGDSSYGPAILHFERMLSNFNAALNTKPPECLQEELRQMSDVSCQTVEKLVAQWDSPQATIDEKERKIKNTKEYLKVFLQSDKES